MLRYGKISEVDYAKGLARVDFDEIGIVSAWLSLPTVSSKGSKYFVPLVVNAQVACLMHRDGEQGEIVKSVWSTVDTPPAWASKDIEGIEFSDGTKLYYNTSAHKLTIDNSGHNVKVEINGGSGGGMVKVSPTVQQLNKIEQDINNLKTAFSTWVVVAQDGGAALKAASATWSAQQLTQTIVNDIEDPNIKQ